MKRKIMMLTSIWKSEFICKVMDGVYRRIEKEDYDLYLFNAYESRGNDNAFLQEHRIYRLPNIRDFDGVIIAINSVGTEEIVRDVVQKCKSTGKPVFCIDQRFEGTCFAGIDNYLSMFQMVEHMVTVHGCKVFNYLGGPEDNEESIQRYRAFCDCLEKYHIEFEPERVSHRSFLQSDGRVAYADWKKQGLQLPDAVICANDEMALGFNVAAHEDGYSAPADYKITGFDNVDDAQNSFPSISSVARNWEELGFRCADAMLADIRSGQKTEEIVIPGGCVLNESCGCEAAGRDVRKAYVSMYQQKKRRDKEEDELKNVRQHLCECDDEKEFQERLIINSKRLGLPEIAVFIAKHGEEEDRDRDYANRMEMICGEDKEIVDIRERLVPAGWQESAEPQIFLFGALYCGKNPSGYSVIRYVPGVLDGCVHKSFVESIGLSLDSILRRKELNESNIKLGKLYVQDSLTGLYNRFGYKQEGARFFDSHEGRVYMAFLDVDGLKTINDRYGHAVGDLAICGIAEAMKAVFRQDQVLVRMGGDEFLVIGSLDEKVAFEDWQGRITDYLKKYSEEKELPFLVEASMGFTGNDTGETNMEALVQKADHEMYQIKQMHKRNRRLHGQS